MSKLDIGQRPYARATTRRTTSTNRRGKDRSSKNFWGASRVSSSLIFFQPMMASNASNKNAWWKRFTKYRRDADGRFTERTLEEYLVGKVSNVLQPAEARLQNFL